MQRIENSKRLTPNNAKLLTTGIIHNGGINHKKQEPS
jgi:hypothetical protein